MEREYIVPNHITKNISANYALTELWEQFQP